MDLVQPQNAIYNDREWGPTFGGGVGSVCDIALSDKCNINKNSFANFPNAYNFTSKPYTNNQ